MEKEQKAIDLLRKLRNLRGNSDMCDLVYRSPAQSLREQADKIEYEDSLIREIDDFLLTNL